MSSSFILRTLVFAASIALAQAQDLKLVTQLLDRVARQEKEFVAKFQSWNPIIETYVQEIADSPEEQGRPTKDHYFLGRLNKGTYTPLLARTDPEKKSFLLLKNLRGRAVTFMPAGFAQMVFLDSASFNRETYSFEYVRREFLGEVRCLVFDVAPLDKKAVGRFIGRIWIEDRDYQIVRFNGTYANSTAHRLFFHFDSWRVSTAPGLWVPGYIYIEESIESGKNQSGPKFKAQTRLWGYTSARSQRLDELTGILVEAAESAVKDQSESKDASPLESQRSWERQAEENIIQRLEKSGLLAAKGEVDAVLNTVVNNLIVTNNLSVEAQCRVMLSTPMESFSIGHTIVVSRGLIDVLPDEASLAMVLADELAHIALGHRTATQFAFTNQTMLGDVEMVQKFRFQRSEQESAAASKRAIEILSNSPYKQKLGNAGLFLRALSAHAPRLPNLIRANLGNQLQSGDALPRFASLISQAPPLEENKLDQIAALPLGSRIKVDPWSNQIGMLKNRPVSLLSTREKMPFEVSPFLVYLTRAEAAPPPFGSN
jgi:hypothetical protein